MEEEAGRRAAEGYFLAAARAMAPLAGALAGTARRHLSGERASSQHLPFMPHAMAPETSGIQLQLYPKLRGYPLREQG